MTSEIIVRLANHNDIEAIQQLHEENVAKKVSDSDKSNEGYVSLPLTNERLKKILESIEIVCAVTQDGKLIGYEIPLDFDLAESTGYFESYLARVAELSFEGENLTADNSVLEAQICIQRGWKGQGIAERMHQTLKIKLKSRFTFFITGIDKANHRSVVAHTKKLGFEILGTYGPSESSWYVLAQRIN